MAETSTPESDFELFRESGDMRALARVFDRLAPELLLVAAHVVRDAALAEDLVQTTFLEAIRSARRWTPCRPVLPWLTGILVHHARKAHRQASRELDAARMPARTMREPPDDVTAQELVAAVSNAIAELPRTYRQVLALRLVHDLQPIQIAHTLGCKPDTVKTRLRRGLEMLRSRLPPGFTMPAALLLAQGRGLAAVRAGVLRCATTRPTVLCALVPLIPLFPLAAFVSVMTMKKALLGVAAAVLLLLVGAFVASGSALSRTSLMQPPSPDVRAAALGVPAERSKDAELPARQELTAPPDATIVFRGRCLAAESGSPLAGCRVRIERPDRPTRDGDFNGFSTELLAAFETTADGVFEVACARDVSERILIKLDHHARLGRQRFCDLADAGEAVDFGDIGMREGTRVSGRVIDQRGAPVAGGSFRLTRGAQVRFDPFPECRYVQEVVAADGTFQVDQPLTPGSWSVWWRGGDAMQPWHVQVQEGLEQHLEIVLPVTDDRQTIRGRIVDTEGSPLVSVQVSGTGGGTYGHAWTAPDGSFAIFRRGPYDATALGPVVLDLEERAEQWRFAGPAPATRWGARGIVVVVRPAARATILPVDSRTGEPIEEYELGVAPIPESGGDENLLGYRPASDRLANGATAIRALRPGPHFVRVRPADPSLLPTGLSRFDAEPDPKSPVVVEVVPAAELTVEVVDDYGIPFAGTQIHVVRSFDAGGPPKQHELARATDSRMRRWFGGGTRLQALGAARSDTEGRARLRAAPFAPHWVWVTGPGHAPAVRGPFVPATVPVRIVISRGAEIRGTVEPRSLIERLGTTTEIEAMRPMMTPIDRAAADERGTRVVVRRVDEEQNPQDWQSDVAMPLAADGSFSCSGLPAGAYDVFLSGVLPHGLDDGQMLMTKLARVTLREGQVAVVRGDVSHLAPGRLRGRLLVNGTPFAHQEVGLRARGLERGERHSLEVALDGDGRFEADLVPGSYYVHIYYRTPGTSNVGYWRSAELAAVASDEVTDFTFHMRRVAARIRVLHDDGTPAPGLGITMHTKREPMGWTSWTTDADGWITIEPAPLDPFALKVAHPNAAQGLAAKLPGAPQDTWLDTMRVPDTGNSVEFEQRLPPGWR